VEWVSGTYYEKRSPTRRNHPQALDERLARELWDRSEESLNIPPSTGGGSVLPTTLV